MFAEHHNRGGNACLISRCDFCTATVPPSLIMNWCVQNRMLRLSSSLLDLLKVWSRREGIIEEEKRLAKQVKRIAASGDKSVHPARIDLCVQTSALCSPVYQPASY